MRQLSFFTAAGQKGKSARGVNISKADLLSRLRDYLKDLDFGIKEADNEEQ